MQLENFNFFLCKYYVSVKTSPGLHVSKSKKVWLKQFISSSSSSRKESLKTGFTQKKSCLIRSPKSGVIRSPNFASGFSHSGTRHRNESGLRRVKRWRTPRIPAAIVGNAKTTKSRNCQVPKSPIWEKMSPRFGIDSVLRFLVCKWIWNKQLRLQ